LQITKIIGLTTTTSQQLQ